MNNTICVIVENSFYTFTWTFRVISEMKNEARRHHLKVDVLVCGMDELLKVKSFIDKSIVNSMNPDIIPVIYIGSIITWQKQVATIYYNDRRIRPIFAGNNICTPDIPISSITLNRDLAMIDLVGHLYNSGARKIALVGSVYNSATDIKRYNGFVAGMRRYNIFNESYIYTFKSGIIEGMEKFTHDAHLYNAVMFSSDSAAIVFLAKALNLGIRIPNDLMVTGFGNYPITNRLRLGLTTVELNIEEIGHQAILLYLDLCRNPQILSMNINIECPVILSSSTSGYVADPELSNPILTQESSFYSAIDFQTLDCLDKLCAKTSELDLKIIKGLVHDISYRKLAEDLYISDSGFRYRLKKIFNFFQVKSKEELQDICRLYMGIGLLD